ncbi:hypothetical protein Cgig2_019616 [Carnegiea gigantea]|uniref:Transmembrane and coiled-coil domain-containing protein 4 n=1 Tax=Carnegiea gigantea TaxID=171969 RepID=A0A9Q1KIU5_9CARY|nr:hypothetical protein Cgig2_019616 [Carnegiea gigantea]
MAASLLSPTQRYAAGALFALALHQAQIHQSRPLGLPMPDHDPINQRMSSGSSSSSDSISDDPDLWVNPNSALLRPIFQFLEIDSMAWQGIEETAGTLLAKHHVGAFLRLLAEESGESSSEKAEQELALSKGVDAMVASIEGSYISEAKRDRQLEYQQQRREKCSVPDMREMPSTSEEKEAIDLILDKHVTSLGDKDGTHDSKYEFNEEPVEEEAILSYQRKIIVLYELLSASLANAADDKKKSKQRKGYDARHRVALRLLATWLDIKWVKVEAMETMIACTAMAIVEEQSKTEEAKSEESSWAKWKRGGIIGAAAVTGGALLAITGGLAAPAIAAGFGALAPTLGTVIPLIGAGGFAAAASVAGSVAGSVAIAASFGAAGAGLTGTKMAKRIGSIDEFEFKAAGENHRQGRLAVGIMVSGFVFDEEDFVMPWEGQIDNLERYVLVWESKHLIAVSTAIQDWLTSTIALALMKQGAMMTVLSTLITALAWPATLLAITDFIDSKWTIAIDRIRGLRETVLKKSEKASGLTRHSVCNIFQNVAASTDSMHALGAEISRSDKAGKLLAEVLLKGLQGNRPVTLVGYSLGARVIFKCLQHLANTEYKANLIERVVLLGAPVPIKAENWEAARKVVAGRFVNVFSQNDWVLGVAFRARSNVRSACPTIGLQGHLAEFNTLIIIVRVRRVLNRGVSNIYQSLVVKVLFFLWNSLLTKGLAGTQAVDVPGIENVDATDMVEGHSSYLWATQQILDQLDLDTYFPVFRGSLTSRWGSCS